MQIMQNESEKAGGRLLRWRLALQSYSYDVVHRSGKSNVAADYLSRNPLDSTDPYDEGPTCLAQFFITIERDSSNELQNINSEPRQIER